MTEKQLWSIRHRDGWCAGRFVRDPSGRDVVRCLCGYAIILPCECKKGRKRVDCPQCKKKLGASDD